MTLAALLMPTKAALKTAAARKAAVVELRPHSAAPADEDGDKIGPLPWCEKGEPPQSSCWTPMEKLPA
ncbi:hypothetical protein [Saccharopolyspora shandongensis]|uniref:hypothetical protein n=1 Tax=Saccharopolyspora shandongensis TaxID=418495 RepID=UPI003402F6A6